MKLEGHFITFSNNKPIPTKKAILHKKGNIQQQKCNIAKRYSEKLTTSLILANSPEIYLRLKKSELKLKETPREYTPRWID